MDRTAPHKIFYNIMFCTYLACRSSSLASYSHEQMNTIKSSTTYKPYRIPKIAYSLDLPEFAHLCLIFMQERCRRNAVFINSILHHRLHFIWCIGILVITHTDLSTSWWRSGSVIHRNEELILLLAWWGLLRIFVSHWRSFLVGSNII